MQTRLKIQSCLNVLIDLTSPHRACREVGNMLTKFEQQDRADITRRSTTHPLAQALSVVEIWNCVQSLRGAPWRPLAWKSKGSRDALSLWPGLSAHTATDFEKIFGVLGRLGYLPPGGKFGLKSRLRKSLPKGRFPHAQKIILSPALRVRRCFFEVYVYFIFFDEVDG